MYDESAPSLDNPKSKRPMSDATRAKIAAARRGKAMSDETKAKIAAAKTGRKAPPDARIRMSRSARKRWSSFANRREASTRALVKAYSSPAAAQRARVDEHRLTDRVEADRATREAKAALEASKQRAILDSVDVARPLSARQAEDMERLAEAKERRESQLVPDGLRPPDDVVEAIAVVEGLTDSEALQYAPKAALALKLLAKGKPLVGWMKKVLILAGEGRWLNEAGLAAIDALGAKLEDR